MIVNNVWKKKPVYSVAYMYKTKIKIREQRKLKITIAKVIKNEKSTYNG